MGHTRGAENSASEFAQSNEIFYQKKDLSSRKRGPDRYDPEIEIGSFPLAGRATACLENQKGRGSVRNIY
jgi:hypothetical protein